MSRPQYPVEPSLPTDMRDLLIRLDQRVDDGFKNVNSKLDEMNRRADGHETRIRTLETWRSELEGGRKGIVGLGAVAKIIMSVAAGVLGVLGFQVALKPHNTSTPTVEVHAKQIERSVATQN